MSWRIDDAASYAETDPVVEFLVALTILALSSANLRLSEVIIYANLRARSVIEHYLTLPSPGYAFPDHRVILCWYAKNSSPFCPRVQRARR